MPRERRTRLSCQKPIRGLITPVDVDAEGAVPPRWPDDLMGFALLAPTTFPAVPDALGALGAPDPTAVAVDEGLCGGSPEVALPAVAGG